MLVCMVIFVNHDSKYRRVQGLLIATESSVHHAEIHHQGHSSSSQNLYSKFPFVQEGA